MPKTPDMSKTAPASDKGKGNGKKSGKGPVPDTSGSPKTPAKAPEAKENGKPEKKEPLKKKVKLEVLYDKIDTRLYLRDPKRAGDSYKDVLPFTLDLAKDLIGWVDENDYAAAAKAAGAKGEVVKYGDSYTLIDRNGVKVRCSFNLTNRPFRLDLAEDWMLEILRGKWRFNGETLIIDKYGMVQDGQHRVIGLILAVQEWINDAKRTPVERSKLKPPVPVAGWRSIWKEQPAIDALVVTGIDSGDDTVNTIGTGKRRTLEDALYRSEWFASLPNAVREKRASSTKVAVNLLWARTDQKLVSFAPRRPHSESFEFIEHHKKILDCVKFISEENDGKKSPQGISHLISLGYAAALMYLMASARSEAAKYTDVNNESVLDWGLWDKAEEFWVDFSSNGKATEALRECLLDIPRELAGGYAQALKCGMIIKAWNLYSDKKKVTVEGVKIKIEHDGEGKPRLTEAPRIGGIDVDYAEADGTEGESPVTAECPQGGEHDWVEEEGERFCSKCKEPQTVAR